MQYSLPTKLLYNIDFTMPRIISVWAFSRGVIQPIQSQRIDSPALFRIVFEIFPSIYLSHSFSLSLSFHTSKHATPSLLFAIIDNEIETRYLHTRFFPSIETTFASNAYREEKLKSLILAKQNRKRKCMKSRVSARILIYRNWMSVFSFKRSNSQ